MKYLLDTHVFLWILDDSRKLRTHALDVITNINNECYLSIVSLWEIAIKLSLGKLEMLVSFDELIEVLRKSQIEIHPVDIEDIFMVKELEFHHRDPFDRMIIAQSKNRGIPVITNDLIFSKYLITTQ